ncbi:conserved protein of unknown function [Nitrosotalea devaniterrae]|uniref:SnoaL-like domain-containing protein n=1 Tax=Nitrosotalea devaniterrae TaxID=1078905 RepID=A0A128A3K7_9ARCH|nr:conserved protein of unknown function [Candidatus Nitrosotalea devanaterra]
MMCPVRRLKLDLPQAIPILSDKEEILDIITTFFNAGKTKNVAPLSVIQLEDPRFSAYSDVPPFDLKDFATTTALEQLRFVSISDYDYELKNLRVDLFDTFAVATFTVFQSGMIVDNYSFRGQHMTMNSRATFVLGKNPKWKIVHLHLTKLSD